MKVFRYGKRAISLAKKVQARRRAVANIRTLRREGHTVPEQHFTIGVYFADGITNLYQMRQWYAPLQELSRRWPVVILARTAVGAEALMRESGLAVAHVPRVRDLERIVTEQPLKIVFYVNQNTRNFQMLRYGARWHVFINHGESDKMYMTTNQIKAYDYALIAGEAAHDRLSARVWNFDVAQRTIQIGRPQTDHLAGTKPFPDDSRTSVLYAPTWEGDRPAAKYGSVVSHGEALVKAILSSPNHRLVYRPHPRTGVVDADHQRANARIIAAIQAANAADPDAHHVYDDSPVLGWQLSETDIAICDISAMIYDRLATGRPVLVTKPVAPEARIDEGGYLSVCEWFTADDAPHALERISSILSDTASRKEQERWSKHYFGDTSQGKPTARFHGAVERLLAEWEAADAAYASRGSSI